MESSLLSAQPSSNKKKVIALITAFGVIAAVVATLAAMNGTASTTKLMTREMLHP